MEPEGKQPWTWADHERSEIALNTGEGEIGRTKLYLVRLAMVDGDRNPLPPEWFSINHAALVNSGVTNDDFYGAVYGETLVSVKAGARPQVTPTATVPLAEYRVARSSLE